MISLQNRLSLHTWTIDTTPFADALRIAREAGFDGIETRYVDFKRCFDAGMSNAQVVDLIRRSGIKVAVMGTEYGVIFAKGEEQKRMMDSLDVMCANAAALGCKVIMLAPGQNPPGTVREAGQSFRRCGEIAHKHGVRLALEFNSRHPVINTLAVAREILALADHPGCGLLLDAYHLQCSGAGGRSFEDVPLADIVTFQYSDVPAGGMSDARRPTDRLAPGKGVVRWNDVFQLLMEKGYDGWLSYEAPNPEHWSRPALDVAREGVSATRKLLATAEASLAKKK